MIFNYNIDIACMTKFIIENAIIYPIIQKENNYTVFSYIDYTNKFMALNVSIKNSNFNVWMDVHDELI